MPRKPRELVAGGVYHVFARGNRRQAIFVDDEDRLRYLMIWGAVAEHLEWRCLAYCLMDNHVHHLVETPNPDLSRGVQLAHGAYGRLFNDTHAATGHVFQGRFGSTRARQDSAVVYFASYVALNPVRAGMCDDPEEHRWSSHAAVVGTAQAPRWLAKDRLLSFYDDARAAAIDRYAGIIDAVQRLGAAGLDPIGGSMDRGPC